MNEDLIKARVEHIEDSNLKHLVIVCLDRLPSYFWTKPSSSTGKYHPSDEHIPGGLSLHTARVVDVVELLCETRILKVSKDEAIAACLLHDVARFGFDVNATPHTLREHPMLGEEFFRQTWNEDNWGVDEDVMQRISHAIGSHMGRWHTSSPESPLDQIVHLADMIAAGYVPVKGAVLK
jgi:23S rRNA maturation-related 3'-5' exoribonuclease YhaM